MASGMAQARSAKVAAIGPRRAAHEPPPVPTLARCTRVQYADRGIDADGVRDHGRPTTEFGARHGAAEMPTPDGPPAPNRAFASLGFVDATAPGARTTPGRSRQAEPVVPVRRARGRDSTPHGAAMGRERLGLEVEGLNPVGKFVAIECLTVASRSTTPESASVVSDEWHVDFRKLLRGFCLGWPGDGMSYTIDQVSISRASCRAFGPRPRRENPTASGSSA